MTGLEEAIQRAAEVLGVNPAALRATLYILWGSLLILGVVLASRKKPKLRGEEPEDALGKEIQAIRDLQRGRK